MKYFIKHLLTFLVVVFALCFQSLMAQVYVNGYYRKDGTYVQSHYRSNPDGNPYNNWSYPGNVNPYTGKVAPGNPDTYLRNYYKIYPTYTATSFNNYNTNLLGTNYKGLKNGYNYDLRQTNGYKTGYIVYANEKTWRIYNNDGKHIGYVKDRPGRRYTVYDINGVFVCKKNGGIGSVFKWVLIIGVAYYIYPMIL